MTWLHVVWFAMAFYFTFIYGDESPDDAMRPLILEAPTGNRRSR